MSVDKSNDLDSIVQMVAMHGTVMFVYGNKTYKIEEAK